MESGCEAWTVTPKLSENGHSFQYFFFQIRQNGKCNVINFKWFLLVMTPDVPAFKVAIFTSDFKIGIGVNDY